MPEPEVDGASAVKHSERGEGRAEASETFLDLLVNPFITASTRPDLIARSHRHRTKLREWCNRLSYRLVLSSASVRLHRDPLWPQSTAAPPAHRPPHRRELVLTALAAAVCEEVGGTTTLQALADEARAMSAAPSVRIVPYDPDNNSPTERRIFRTAVRRLVELGVLVRRTSDESMARRWEEQGTGIGEGYEVDSEALLQFSDPYTVALVFDTAPSNPEEAEHSRLATRGSRMLRTLVENTALLYADLDPADAEYARAQRSWLARIAVEMTGGTVETRDEGMVLRLAEDHPVAQAATFAFPEANAAHWFALTALGRAVPEDPRPDGDGRLTLTDSEVAALMQQLREEYPRALTVEIRKPKGLRSAVERVLTGLGVLRVCDSGSWTLLPTAGRWRSPNTTWEAVAIDGVLLTDEDDEDDPVDR